MVQDLATQWIQPYPCKTKTSQETEKSSRCTRDGKEFTKVHRAVAKKPTVFFSDTSLEFGKSCEDLSWNHRISTLHRSETNGIAGRAVRQGKEGISAVSLQSGLDERWWSDSMECYCSAICDTSKASWTDGKTPYERRFGQPFKGPIILFGALIEYHPNSPKGQTRVHQCGKKVSPSIFLGHALIAGRTCRGDILMADLEDLEKWDALGNLSSKNQCERSIDNT